MLVVLIVSNFVRLVQSFASLMAGLKCLHLSAYAGSVMFELQKPPQFYAEVFI